MRRLFNGTGWALDSEGRIRFNKLPDVPYLKDEGLNRFHSWKNRYNDFGCTCFQSAPCSVCTDEDHPMSIDSDPEMWMSHEEYLRTPEGKAWEEQQVGVGIF